MRTCSRANSRCLPCHPSGTLFEPECVVVGEVKTPDKFLSAPRFHANRRIPLHPPPFSNPTYPLPATPAPTAEPPTQSATSAAYPWKPSCCATYLIAGRHTERLVTLSRVSQGRKTRYPRIFVIVSPMCSTPDFAILAAGCAREFRSENLLH